METPSHLALRLLIHVGIKCLHCFSRSPSVITILHTWPFEVLVPGVLPPCLWAAVIGEVMVLVASLLPTEGCSPSDLPCIPSSFDANTFICLLIHHLSFRYIWWNLPRGQYCMLANMWALGSDSSEVQPPNSLAVWLWASCFSECWFPHL